MNYIDPANKLVWHKDKLDAIAAGMRPMPVNVEIDLSNRCSLGCEWCHFAYTHTRGPLASNNGKAEGMIPGGDLMDTALALQILSEFGRAGVQSVTWTGGGEPTLHPDFEVITEHAYTEDLDQGMYTHGGHIDDDRAWHIKQIFTWVVISMDEVNPLRYKQRKKVDKFSDACRGVELLAKHDGDCVVGLSFMIDRENFHEAERMVMLGHKLGADYVQFRPTINYRLERPNEPAEDTSWVTPAINHLEIFAKDKYVQVDLNRFKMYRDWQGHDYARCWWSALQATVTPNGKLWICANKREYPGAELGDLNDDTFVDIWQRHGVFNVNEQCRVSCRGHVPNLAAEQILREPVHASFI